jgi:NAD(P)-dependent dehydrogenase (short-subunit alcohol dehydrogenase family)
MQVEAHSEKSDFRRQALVTGAASGIGRAIAIGMSRRGDRVAILDVDPVGLDGTLELLDGTQHLAVECDVADPAAVAATVATIGDRFGAFASLVNAAGIAVRGRIDSIDLGLVDRMLDVNVKGTYLMIRSAHTLIPSGGSIVNLASAASVRGAPYLAAYAATKGAIDGLTRSLAVELAERGIRVNCVSPGAVATPMLDRLDPPADACADVLVRSRPLDRRAGTTDDVAAAVLYLTSPQAGHVNGINLVIDGGGSC